MSEPTLHQGLEGLAAREAAPYFCPDLEGWRVTVPDPADPPDDDGEELRAWCVPCGGWKAIAELGDDSCRDCSSAFLITDRPPTVREACAHLEREAEDIDFTALQKLVTTPEDLALFLAAMVASPEAELPSVRHFNLAADVPDVLQQFIDQQNAQRARVGNRILDLQSSMMAACDAGGVPIHVATEQGGIEYLSLEQRMVMLGELAARANEPEKTPAGAAPPAEPAEAEALDPGPVLTWAPCQYEVRSAVDTERRYTITGEQLHAGGRPVGITVQTLTTDEHPYLGVVSAAGLQMPTGLNGTFRTDRERPESVPTIIAAARAVGEMAARRTRLWECTDAEAGVAAFRATWASAEAFEADAQAAIQQARAAARAGVAHG